MINHIIIVNVFIFHDKCVAHWYNKQQQQTSIIYWKYQQQKQSLKINILLENVGMEWQQKKEYSSTSKT